MYLLSLQTPLSGSPRSQIQKAGFMSPSAERNQEFAHLFQTDTSRFINPVCQTVLSSTAGSSQSVLASKPASSQSVLADKTLTGPSVMPSKPSSNETTISSKPATSQLVTSEPASQLATSSKPSTNQSNLTSKAGMVQPVSSKLGNKPSLTGKPETSQSVVSGLPEVSMHKPVFPVPSQPAAGIMSARPLFSVLPKKTVLSSQPCVSSQLSGHSSLPSGPTPKAHPSEHAPKPNSGALDLSLQRTSLSSETGKVTEHMFQPVGNQARHISVPNTHAVKPSRDSSHSLLTRLVNQPGQILTDVQQVVQQSVADLRPIMPSAEIPCPKPPPFPNTDTGTFVPPKPPSVSPPLSPGCILISDGESSLSSLLDYTIELNDSDFDEPIVIMSPDDNNQ